MHSLWTRAVLYLLIFRMVSSIRIIEIEDKAVCFAIDASTEHVEITICSVRWRFYPLPTATACANG